MTNLLAVRSARGGDVLYLQCWCSVQHVLDVTGHLAVCIGNSISSSATVHCLHHSLSGVCSQQCRKLSTTDGNVCRHCHPCIDDFVFFNLCCPRKEDSPLDIDCGNANTAATYS